MGSKDDPDDDEGMFMSGVEESGECRIFPTRPNVRQPVGIAS